MKLLSTGSYSPYFENRKLVRGCTSEVSPWLETGYCEPGVVNWKLFRSWKPDSEPEVENLIRKPDVMEVVYRKSTVEYRR